MWGATIAHLPGSNPYQTIYAFIKLYLNCDENKQKRGRDWPILIRRSWSWIQKGRFCCRYKINRCFDKKGIILPNFG